MNGFWIAILAGAITYWITRWQRDYDGANRMNFVQYLKLEWPAFVYCVIGGFVLTGIYVYAGEQILTVLGRLWTKLEGLKAPEFNVVFAFLFGVGGKVFIDRVPRIINWFGARIKLPGVN